MKITSISSITGVRQVASVKTSLGLRKVFSFGINPYSSPYELNRYFTALCTERQNRIARAELIEEYGLSEEDIARKGLFECVLERVK